MAVEIDSSEVLQHLNKCGIRSIDEDAFKQFLKDLKKLIKYEQRKKESPDTTISPFRRKSKETTIPSQTDVDCNCDIRISSCCPTSCATVTYVHSPCKSNENLVKVCDCPTKEIQKKNSNRSSSSLSHTRLHQKNRRKVNDPVELYHYYQSIWKHHKLPGENDHAELRQAIRNRLTHLK